MRNILPRSWRFIFDKEFYIQDPAVAEEGRNKKLSERISPEDVETNAILSVFIVLMLTVALGGWFRGEAFAFLVWKIMVVIDIIPLAALVIGAIGGKNQICLSDYYLFITLVVLSFAVPPLPIALFVGYSLGCWWHSFLLVRR